MIVLYGDKKEAILSIKFDDIVDQIPNLRDYKWKLIWIIGMNSEIKVLNLPEKIGTMMELSNRTNFSLDGYLISGDDLINIAKSFSKDSYQLEEVILIGDKSEENLVKYIDQENFNKNGRIYIDEDKIKNKVEFYIDLVEDTVCWEIISSNNIFNQNLKNNLGGKEV